MRLITHTDLDGAMCAVLLFEVEEILEIEFADPATLQAGRMMVTKDDVIADLPYDKRCGMWFDHHESSRPPQDRRFDGCWKPADSAARVIFDFYESPYLEVYRKAVEEADRIDSGRVSLDEARRPSGWFLLSNTLESSTDRQQDKEYRLHVIELIGEKPQISKVMADPWVKRRVAIARQELGLFKKILLEKTVMVGGVAFSDLRDRPDLPRGNNYLVYSLFPDAVTSVRLMPEREEKDFVKISVGHSVFGKKSDFDIGAAMKKIGGGGHRAVGGASVKKEEAETIAKKIVGQINEFEEDQVAGR